MGKACDDYLLKKRAYDRVAQELDDAVHRLRAFSRPLIEDCGCNVPLPGMSVHAYISASRRALEGSNAIKRRRIAELMKRAFFAQKEAIRAWELLLDQERSELKPPVDSLRNDQWRSASGSS